MAACVDCGGTMGVPLMLVSWSFVRELPGAVCTDEHWRMRVALMLITRVRRGEGAIAVVAVESSMRVSHVLLQRALTLELSCAFVTGEVCRFGHDARARSSGSCGEETSARAASTQATGGAGGGGRGVRCSRDEKGGGGSRRGRQRGMRELTGPRQNPAAFSISPDLCVHLGRVHQEQ